MQKDEINYYRRRAEMETDLAEKARHPQAVAAHYQLATMYFERVGGREQAELTSCG